MLLEPLCCMESSGWEREAVESFSWAFLGIVASDVFQLKTPWQKNSNERVEVSLGEFCARKVISIRCALWFR